MGTALVRDVMTRAVVGVHPEAGFKELVEVLLDAEISAVPVLSPDGTVLGVVSEADLLRAGAPPVTDRCAPGTGGTARTMMTTPAVTCRADLSVTDAVRLMHRHGVHRLPVVDGTGRLTGLVSRRDVLRLYLPSDRALRQVIAEQVLRRSMWLDGSGVRVRVTGGRACLSGRVDRRSTAQEAVRLTAAVPGIVAVEDHLSWTYDDRTRAGRRHP